MRTRTARKIEFPDSGTLGYRGWEHWARQITQAINDLQKDYALLALALDKRQEGLGEAGRE